MYCSGSNERCADRSQVSRTTEAPTATRANAQRNDLSTFAIVFSAFTTAPTEQMAQLVPYRCNFDAEWNFISQARRLLNPRALANQTQKLRKSFFGWNAPGRVIRLRLERSATQPRSSTQ